MSGVSAATAGFAFAAAMMLCAVAAAGSAGARPWDIAGEVPWGSAQAGLSWSSARMHNIEPTGYETENLRMCNENRTGIQPFTFNASLVWSARDFSKYLCENDLFTHVPAPTDPAPYGGTDPSDRFGNIQADSGGKFGNYGGTWWAENIALMMGDTPDPYSDMDGWMNSAGHRANIQDYHNWELGVGTYSYGGYVKSTQDFGGTNRVIDLAISGPDISSSPPSPNPGDPVHIAAKVKNIAKHDAWPVTISAYLGNPETNGTLLGSALLPIIFINKDTVTASLDWDTSGRAAGYYDVYFKVESDYPTNDSDDSNNIAHITVGLGTGTVPGGSGPALASSFLAVALVTAAAIAFSRGRRVGE